MCKLGISENGIVRIANQLMNPDQEAIEIGQAVAQQIFEAALDNEEEWYRVRDDHQNLLIEALNQANMGRSGEAEISGFRAKDAFTAKIEELERPFEREFEMMGSSNAEMAVTSLPEGSSKEDTMLHFMNYMDNVGDSVNELIRDIGPVPFTREECVGIGHNGFEQELVRLGFEGWDE